MSKRGSWGGIQWRRLWLTAALSFAASAAVVTLALCGPMGERLLDAPRAHVINYLALWAARFAILAYGRWRLGLYLLAAILFAIVAYGVSAADRFLGDLSIIGRVEVPIGLLVVPSLVFSIDCRFGKPASLLYLARLPAELACAAVFDYFVWPFVMFATGGIFI